MHRNRFYVLALIAMLVISGGCGGSSNSFRSNTNNSEPRDTRTEWIVSAIKNDCVEGSDIASLVGEIAFLTGLAADDDEDDPLTILADMVKKGGAVFFDYGSIRSDAEVNNIENVKAAYETGAAICIVYATQAQVDEIFEELGIKGGNVMPEGSVNPHTELVAVKKTEAGTWIYVIPSLANFDVESDEEAASDLTEDEKKEFNRERLQRVVEWIKDNNTDSSSVKASEASEAEDLTKLSRVTHYTLDFSYQDSKADQYGKKNFYNVIAYDVYSCHSFADNKDYFVVEMNSVANPSKQAYHELLSADRQIGSRTIKCTVDTAVGYLSSFKIANDIDVNGFLIDSKPESQKTDIENKTENVYMNFGNVIAYMPVGNGRYFPEFNNVIYDKDLIHTVTGFEINAVDATWTLTFPRPKDGEEVEGNTASTTYQKIEPAESSIISRRDRMVYIYEIDRSAIIANGNKVTLTTDVNTVHGLTQGNTYKVDVDADDYRFPRVDSTWYTSSKKMQLSLPLPPTVGTSGPLFHTGRSSGAVAIQIRSATDWTIDPQCDWIRVEPSSGNGTGSGAANIIIYFDENNTTSTRQAEILLKNTYGDSLVMPFIQAN